MFKSPDTTGLHSFPTLDWFLTLIIHQRGEGGGGGGGGGVYKYIYTYIYMYLYI